MYRKKLKVLMILVFLIGMVFAQKGYALPPDKNTWFIDSDNGSDANSGTSESSPWKSLAKLMTVKLSPGETVRFKRGYSYIGPLFIIDSGNQINYITISD